MRAIAESCSVSQLQNMDRKWLCKEYKLLHDMKQRLADDMKTVTPYPEVVGDRRLMRFLRGHNHNVEKATKMYRDFLSWRRENAIDEVRNDIVYGRKNDPTLFPKGELIMRLVPQIVMTPTSTDLAGQPIVYEADGYSPREVLESITIEDYTIFLIYVLEYRAIVLEQLSEEADKQYEAQNPDPASRTEGYGALIKLCMIRDLKGLGLEHLGSQFKSIVMKFLTIAVPNYPEQVGKFHVINAPWVFSAIWSFAKRILDSGTLSKFALYGSEFMEGIQTDIPITSIPQQIGGQLVEGNGPFLFDISETGPLHYTGAPTPETYVSKQINLSTSLLAPLREDDGFVAEEGDLVLNMQGDAAEFSPYATNDSTTISVATNVETGRENGHKDPVVAEPHW